MNTILNATSTGREASMVASCHPPYIYFRIVLLKLETIDMF